MNFDGQRFQFDGQRLLFPHCAFRINVIRLRTNLVLFQRACRRPCGSTGWLFIIGVDVCPHRKPYPSQNLSLA
jgi:hypothetical protein